jgi:hypothetical protein
MRLRHAALLLLASCEVAPPDGSELLPSAQSPLPQTSTLAVSGIEGGQPTTFTISGGPPNATLKLARAVGGGIGAGPCPPVLGGGCLDISGPQGIALFPFNLNTNAAGAASITVTVPATVPDGVPVGFQAVHPASGTGSNPVALTTGPQTCTSWLATYDLTGSVFTIEALFDFTITLQTPYSGALNMGPGSITLRLPDVGGAPGAGPVAVTEYALTQNFVTGISGFASVTSNLQNNAGPACSVATGTLAAGTAVWDAPGLSPHCTVGQISCSGIFCGTSGAPPSGSPTQISTCDDLDLQDFTFTSGFATFSSTPILVSQTTDQTTRLRLQGTRTGLVEETVPGACGCP